MATPRFVHLRLHTEYSLLEGAMVVARSLNDPDRFDKASAAFLRVLKPTKQP